MATLCIAFSMNAQTLGYTDVGVLFSTEKIMGTARYNAMSGAFGALGGDLSAIDINPAGTAVFALSEFATTLNIADTETMSTYYGMSNFTSNNVTNMPQVGGVFVFRPRNSVWTKTAIAFNYSSTNEFENFWLAEGNSNYPTYIFDPNDEEILYLNSDGQYFENITDGAHRKYSFSFAGELNNKIYVGASLIQHDIDHFQRILLEEYNYNDNNDIMDASLIQELLTYGTGFSFNLGVIAKATENLRLGFAYESPTWYDLNEDYVDYDLEIYVSNTNELFTDFSGVNNFRYKLKTPYRLTGSLAYIFGKEGLLSFDYTFKDFKTINLSGSNFSQENIAIDNSLQAVHQVKVGAEWRINRFSLRGGYNYENSPYKDAISSDDLEGFSLGAGFNFGAGKIDFAYQNSSNTAPYNFYPQYPEISNSELEYDFDTYSITLVLNM